MGRTSLSSSGSPPTFTPCLSLPRNSSPVSPSALPTLPPYVTHGPPNPVALAHALGPADCNVRGDGFNLPAHSSVLQARCPVMHAQFKSGMRDADAREVTLPPHFAEAPVRATLDYMCAPTPTTSRGCAIPLTPAGKHCAVLLIHRATLSASGVKCKIFCGSRDSMCVKKSFFS